jgi:aldose 1-epimerase
MEIRHSTFGKLDSGEDVSLYTLKNDNAMEVRITNYGATIVTLKVPDKKGQVADIVLGFESVEGYRSDAYLKGCPYFGCTVGRYTNRIKNAEFKLDGKEYKISRNEGTNSLHGGNVGFDKKLWTVIGDGVCSDDCACVEMFLCSPDGDQGYPGTLKTTVKFSLQKDNNLLIEYSAVSDQDTAVNLTNHSYFNLEGEGVGNVLNNSLFIPSRLFLNLDGELLPDGQVLDVDGTSLDFRSSPSIGDAMKKDGNDKITGGYSHTYILENAPELSLAARLSTPDSGRVMEIFTTDVGVLVYTGDGLDGSFIGKSGKKYNKWGGVCLETQGIPDALNNGHFKSGFLKAEEKYYSKTVYRFLTE